MNALKADIEESLQRGLKIAWHVALEPQLRQLGPEQTEAVLVTLENLMRERAANLAQWMAEQCTEESHAE